MTHREQCPVCYSRGLDRSGDNLIVYDNGSAHCFACGYHEDTNKQMPNDFTPLTLTAIDWKDKGLERSTLERYGVGLDDNGVFTFPYYTPEGELVAYKQRPEVGDVKFVWEGSAKQASWFGLSTINPDKQHTLVLAEGESDTLSLAQSLGKQFAVLGLSKGAGTAANTIKGSLHILKRFKKIVVAFDNDSAGQEARQAALSLLPKSRAYVLNLPPGVKDANEALLSGHDLKALVGSAAPSFDSVFHTQDKLVDDTVERFFNQSVEGLLGIDTGIPELNEITRGYIPGNVLTFMADTGVGKTTFVFELMYRLMVQDVPVLLLPLEMSASEVMMKLAARHLQKPILSKPLGAGKVTKQELTDALVWVSTRLLIPKHFGSMTTDELRDYMELARDAHDVQVVVLDHVTAAATGKDGLDWKSIDGFVSQSKSLMVELEMTLLMVTHTTPSDKYADGTRELDLNDIRGSKSIAQYSDIVFGIRRPDGLDAPLMELKVIKKHRLVGVKRTLKFVQENESTINIVGQHGTRNQEHAQGGRQDSEVRLEARVPDTHSEPAVEPQDTEDRVRDTSQVHAGLHHTDSKQSNRESIRAALKAKLAARANNPSRKQGVPERTGQAEDEVGSRSVAVERKSDTNTTGTLSRSLGVRAKAFAH